MLLGESGNKNYSTSAICFFVGKLFTIIVIELISFAKCKLGCFPVSNRIDCLIVCMKPEHNYTLCCTYIKKQSPCATLSTKTYLKFEVSLMFLSQCCYHEYLGRKIRDYWLAWGIWNAPRGLSFSLASLKTRTSDLSVLLCICSRDDRAACLVHYKRHWTLLVNCQRPAFSLGVSQHMHKRRNLLKLELDWSPKLRDNYK